MALCEQTLAAVLFNLGVLLEVGRCINLLLCLIVKNVAQMSGKADDARTSCQESLEQAKRIGLRSAAMEARSALRRIDRITGV